MVVYQFNCFCEDSYSRMTSNKFGKRIKKTFKKVLMGFVKLVIRKINL